MSMAQVERLGEQPPQRVEVPPIDMALLPPSMQPTAAAEQYSARVAQQPRMPNSGRPTQIQIDSARRQAQQSPRSRQWGAAAPWERGPVGVVGPEALKAQQIAKSRPAPADPVWASQVRQEPVGRHNKVGDSLDSFVNSQQNHGQYSPRNHLASEPSQHSKHLVERTRQHELHHPSVHDAGVVSAKAGETHTIDGRPNAPWDQGPTVIGSDSHAANDRGSYILQEKQNSPRGRKPAMPAPWMRGPLGFAPNPESARGTAMARAVDTEYGTDQGIRQTGLAGVPTSAQWTTSAGQYGRRKVKPVAVQRGSHNYWTYE